MTQEEKDLLLKDLCARLPYGVMIEITSDGGMMEAYYDMRLDAGLFADLLQSENDFKPYLRPMSSMTEKEKLQLIHYAIIGDGHIAGVNFVDWVERKNVQNYIDWLNKHHFDYRGLIEKGLALEATEDMYKGMR